MMNKIKDERHEFEKTRPVSFLIDSGCLEHRFFAQYQL